MSATQITQKSFFRLTLLLFIMLGISNLGWTQTTIGLQNFDASGSTMTYAASATNGTFGTKGGFSDNSGTTKDYLSGVSFYNSSANGYWVNNGNATITCANVTGLGSYIGKKVSISLAAFSMQSSTNGPDAADNVIVGVSLNGGTTYSNEIDVNGGTSGNVWWHYSTGTGVASRTYLGDNTPTSFAPTTAGNQTTNGYSTIELDIPDNATQVRVRIIMDNNSGGEAWVIDDIKITGCLITSYAVTGGGSYCSGGSGVAVGLVYSQSGCTYQLYRDGTTTVGTPVNGNNAAISFGNQTVAGTYTVVGTYTAGGCSANMPGSASVLVNTTPTVVSITPSSASICNGTIQQLTASGGQITQSQSLFSELCNTLPSTYTLSGTGATAVLNTTYQAEGSGSVLIREGNNNQTGYYTLTNSLNLTGLTSPVLSFSHICATETDYDYGYVEYSTNGGTNWTSFPTNSYAGSGTLKNGVVSFDASSYTDWDSRFTATTSTPTNSLWKPETIIIPSAAISSSFKIRFRTTTDNSTIYYGWLIDNVKITYSENSSSFTWAPIANLYTDAGATVAYTGNVTPVVYTKPPSPITYTATSTSGNGCTNSANVLVTVNSLPTITLDDISSICAGSSSFTIPYTTTTGSPNQYSISGTGITAVTNGPLGATPITVNLSSPASGSSIPFVLTVRNNTAECVSGNVNGSVTVNALPTFSYTSTNITCYGLTNGSITITASGGTGFYTYSLLNGDNFPYNGDSPHTIPNLLPNTYSLQVKDSNGCIQTTCQ